MAGQGPVLVLIHGFPQSGILWQEVWSKLSDNFTVIIPDLPGSGESAFAGKDLTIEQLAKSVQCILEKEHVNEVVIAGHSMGGYTALAFAELYPETIMGLSMVHSIKDADTEAKKENRRKAIALIEKGGKEAFIRQMIPGLFSEEFKYEHPEVIADQINKGKNVPDESLVAFYNAMINRPDRGKVLTDGHFPVQWIVGREDSIASAEKVLQQTRLASVNFVSVYDECAHMSMLEQPVELIKDLTYFVKYCYKREHL